MRVLNDDEIGNIITESHSGNVRGSDFVDEARPAVNAQFVADIKAFEKLLKGLIAKADWYGSTVPCIPFSVLEESLKQLVD